ncbi:MAG: PaaI family thioesterase [Gemmatimonas sp.]
MLTPEDFNHRSADFLPGLLGVTVTHVAERELRAELAITRPLIATNGYLHAASVIGLADTSAGYGCVANLPPEAVGFTTVELKCNYVGTARSGTIECVATAAHIGRTTQVWDATVVHRETGKTIALFRCTQMVLYENEGKRGVG